MEGKSFDNVKLVGGAEDPLGGQVEDTGSLVVQGADLEFRGAKTSFSMPGVRRLSTSPLGRLLVEFGDPPEEREFITGRGLRVRSATKELLAELKGAMNLAPVSLSTSEAQALRQQGTRDIWLVPVAVLAAPVALFAAAFAFRFVWRGVFASDWDAASAVEFAWGLGAVGVGVGIMAGFFLYVNGRGKRRRSEGL